ncbi:hypothetical protein ES703_50233 [subsurface metagenome]
MNDKKEVVMLIFIGLLIIIGALFKQIDIEFEFHAIPIEEKSEFSSDDNHEHHLRPSAFWVLNRIHVNNNWSTTAGEDWCRGNGTFTNPYIIENVIINNQNSSSCILIENTNEFFIINNCTIYNSGSDYDDAGIKMKNVNNSKILENNCSHNNIGMYLSQCNDNSIARNLVTDNLGFGIYFDHCDNNIITENIVKNHIVFQNFGISLSICKYNTISQNLAQNNYFGIAISPILIYPGSSISHNNTIWRNTANHNVIGIFLSGKFGGCQNNTVLENNVNNNYEYGIYALQSHEILFRENIINNNSEDGISVQWCSNCKFINNLIENNENNGVTVYFASHDNTFFRNIISNNLQTGISFYSGSYSNLIYRNCFIGNIINAQDNGTDNAWDNGISGNYWGDYTGLDEDGNGIGDVPYNISGTARSQDNFPLMKCPISAQDGEGFPLELIILIPIISGGAVIGVATLLLIRRKRKRIE